MSNSDEIKQKEREEELEREAVGSRRMIGFLTIGVFALICVGIWFATYTIRGRQLDDYVNSIEYVNNEETESASATVKLVTVTIDDVDYTLDSLKDKEDLPTVVDVTVTYTDDSTVSKSAYISYVDSTSVSEVSYQDNEYGRILIPQEEGK